jgi:hypothetical protein
MRGRAMLGRAMLGRSQRHAQKLFQNSLDIIKINSQSSDGNE